MINTWYSNARWHEGIYISNSKNAAPVLGLTSPPSLRAFLIISWPFTRSLVYPMRSYRVTWNNTATAFSNRLCCANRPLRGYALSQSWFGYLVFNIFTSWSLVIFEGNPFSFKSDMVSEYQSSALTMILVTYGITHVPPLFQVAVPPLLLLEGDCPYLPNIPKALFGLLQQNVPNPKGSEDILSWEHRRGTDGIEIIVLHLFVSPPLLRLYTNLRTAKYVLSGALHCRDYTSEIFLCLANRSKNCFW